MFAIGLLQVAAAGKVDCTCLEQAASNTLFFDLHTNAANAILLI